MLAPPRFPPGAGLVPWCLDRFGDADLAGGVAEVVCCPLDQYPQHLPELLGDAPSASIIYTGGLENYPAVVAEMGRLRPLWGNDPEVLRRVRDPFFVVLRVLVEQGLRCPELGQSPLSGSFLASPSKGLEGGRHPYWQFRRFADAGLLLPAIRARPGLFRRLLCFRRRCSIAGRHDAIDRRVVAVCEAIPVLRQHWPGRNAAGRRVRPRPAWRSIAFGVRAVAGLFGIDFVLHEGEPWLIEINPRYTASIEILEYATGLKTLEVHRSVFEGKDALCSVAKARRVRGQGDLVCACGDQLPVPWTLDENRREAVPPARIRRYTATRQPD